MIEYKNRTALITGASMGMGATFARAFAARGASVILVARSEEKLRSVAKEITEANNVRADVIATDLSKPNAANIVHEEIRARGKTIDFLVNNAGFATYGRFDESDDARDAEEIMLNCRALVSMTRTFLPSMVHRGEGGIINVASTAAFQPLPYMAIYGATKAFVLSFSEALWAENRSRGVRVLALCPGATDTPFFDVVAAPEASVGRREKPEVVVSRALNALEAGKSYVVSGTRNYWIAHAGRFLPRRTVSAATERIMRPRAVRALKAVAD